MIIDLVVILLLFIIILLKNVICFNKSFTLEDIAKEYEIMKKYDVNLLISNYGYPYKPNICLISQYERLLLYILAKFSSGNILEEGSYCGCSTIYLAAGARDNGNNFYDNGNNFLTSDIFASGIENSNSPMRYTITNENKIGLKVWNELIFEFDSISYNYAFNDVLNHNSIYNGNMLSCLYHQLYQQNLHHNVTIIAGLVKNIASLIDYHLIWSDAAHDLNEINKNSKIWKIITNNSIKHHNMIFCFHDVGGDEILQDAIKEVFIEYTILNSLILDNIYAIEISIKNNDNSNSNSNNEL